MMFKAEREFQKLTETKTMTDNEDKFARFFNSETVLIASMTEAERIDHIQELEEIAFEAKARLHAAKTYDRVQKGKKFAGGDYTITPVTPDQTTSDTINRVKLRTSRMTKLDKTRQGLEKLGLDDKTIDAMISAMTKQARKDDPNDRKPPPSNGVAVPKKPNQPNAPSGASEQLPVVESKPLDLSDLKFS
jgi:hypothetical protein